MPTLSFLCPEQSSKCSRSPHLASMDNFENLLTCCLKPEKVFHPLNSNQRLWLTSPVDGKLLTRTSTCIFVYCLLYHYSEFRDMRSETMSHPTSTPIPPAGIDSMPLLGEIFMSKTMPYIFGERERACTFFTRTFLE